MFTLRLKFSFFANQKEIMEINFLEKHLLALFWGKFICTKIWELRLNGLQHNNNKLNFNIQHNILTITVCTPSVILFTFFHSFFLCGWQHFVSLLLQILWAVWGTPVLWTIIPWIWNLYISPMIYHIFRFKS